MADISFREPIKITCTDEYAQDGSNQTFQKDVQVYAAMTGEGKKSKSDEEQSPVSTIAEDDSFYVDFEEDDSRDPVNFSLWRKWAITITACAFTGIVAASSSSFTMGYDTMMRDLNCTEFQATVALSLYTLGFGVVPLVTSSFSEEFGRHRLYIVCSLVFTLSEIAIALANNIQTVIIARSLGGGFGSTGATLVGGTIADIWRPQQRGLPMSIFALAAVASTGLGPVISGWVDANPHLGWRWIQWIHAMFTGAYFLCVLVFMKETRSTIILTRLARKIRKETGNERYRARAEDEKRSLSTMVYISCTRPLRLLLTEPTVQSFSLWVGFTWGVLFCLVESVAPELQSLYGFGVGETGSAFTALTIGSILGFIANMYQETLYQKYHARKGQEARLYLACVAALLLPTGMYIYAWTASPKIPWIAPLIGLTTFMFSAYVIYQVTFIYLADCYGPYASSALAGQSLFRNLLATAFPLFTQQMFSRLTYRWANMLFAIIATVMIPIPYILFLYGSKIRARSKFSRMVLEAEAQQCLPAKK
ncbi:major facilitator superfamily domain-containing protein [Hygrophoropsis aurantiaca]|uniref:Major facilitator superfamily domain-containing protein n=1 Tax=Hygrophoropsis aurantiaca TaxID=72124 RepID=A0ACB8A5C1_9AGAM|nr:major facilitator superfamily domain-containing protein [Hygrophoropsis aurantiaca]